MATYILVKESSQPIDHHISHEPSPSLKSEEFSMM